MRTVQRALATCSKKEQVRFAAIGWQWHIVIVSLWVGAIFAFNSAAGTRDGLVRHFHGVSFPLS